MPLDRSMLFTISNRWVCRSELKYGIFPSFCFFYILSFLFFRPSFFSLFFILRRLFRMVSYFYCSLSLWFRALVLFIDNAPLARVIIFFKWLLPSTYVTVFLLSFGVEHGNAPNVQSESLFSERLYWQSTKTSWPQEITWNGKYILRGCLFSTSEADGIHVIEEK